MNLDAPQNPLRHSYEHLMLQAERIRQRIPSAAVLTSATGRGRLALELVELRGGVEAAPTFGGSSSSRRLRAEARALCDRIDLVLARMEDEPNAAKLHRDAAALLESVRRFALGRIDAASDAA